MASASPPCSGNPNNDPSTAGGKNRASNPHLIAENFSSGITRSIKISWRIGNHGNSCIFRTTKSTVKMRSIPLCRIALSMAALPAVKLRFTGIRPANTTAKLAIMPPLPGGNTIPMRGAFVSFLIY